MEIQEWVKTIFLVLFLVLSFFLTTLNQNAETMFCRHRDQSSYRITSFLFVASSSEIVGTNLLSSQVFGSQEILEKNPVRIRFESLQKVRMQESQFVIKFIINVQKIQKYNSVQTCVFWDERIRQALCWYNEIYRVSFSHLLHKKLIEAGLLME